MLHKETIKQIITDFPLGIINWYDVSWMKNVLIISSENNEQHDSLFSSWFEEQDINATVVHWKVTTNDTFLEKNGSFFDAVIAIRSIEFIKEPIDSLKKWKELLQPKGKLLLATDNRLGLRFFCGDRDPYSNRNFDGIENYRRVGKYDKEQMDGRLFSKHEISIFLHKTGWEHNKWYSVLPNLSMPQLIYAEGIVPKEDLDMRFFPKYYHPDSVFLEEQFLYNDIIKNGMFHNLANSYLIECSLDGQFDSADFVTLSMDRGEEKSFATIVQENKCVTKKALFQSGDIQIRQLFKNSQNLHARGISVVDGKIDNNAYIMPYIDAKLGITHLRELALHNSDKFIEEIDTLIQIVRNSSDIVIKKNNGSDIELLEKGYIDLVPWNSFYKDGSYLFFDQEFCKDNYPLDAIIYRIINLVYTIEIEQHLPKEFFWDKYCISHRLSNLAKLEDEFINDIRHRSALQIEMEKYQPNSEVLHTNRQRLNYSADDFNRKFVSIFPKIASRPIVLFGAGKFSKRFLELYGKKYTIEAIVDNNQKNWDTQLSGITIKSPVYLMDKKSNGYCLIVCIKNYTGVIKQLQGMGISDYGIYIPGTKYPRSEVSLQISKENLDPKKTVKSYHTGYIAGVFDLFHIGHINLLKAAKEQCQHLIVGVVSDEGVKKYKKVEPFIPCQERKEVLTSCRYVDEVVEIPLNLRGSRDAYNLYQFDCQFSGSDYENDPVWLSDKEYLQKHGSDIVFLPYTKQTSSSKIKEKLSGKLYE